MTIFEHNAAGKAQRLDEPIVIVGGGQAGGWAAKTLREKAPKRRIVMIADELHPPHERPPLSKEVLTGVAQSDSTYLFKTGQLEALDIDLRLGIRVRAIDRTERALTLSDGSRLAYTRLLLCCGGSARRLAVAGSDLPQVHTLRSIEDAHRIRDAIRGARRLAIIGGGWLGLEVAAAARRSGVDTIIVEATPRLCQRSVPENISDFLTALHTQNGAQVILGRAVQRFTGQSGGVVRVELQMSDAIEADAVVVAVGLVPNDALARDAGLKTDGGIVVDDACLTSDPDIFAAGDVAVSPNRWLGRPVRLESWQNAQDQGIAASRSALGESVSYDPLPRFWSEQYGINIQIVGFTETADRSVLDGAMQAGRFVIHYFKGNRMVAAIGANSPRELRTAQRQIERDAVIANHLPDAKSAAAVGDASVS
jgi:3-phenylpropionate/trans-cinnamate dioxygenase ferredoxin reductase component